MFESECEGGGEVTEVRVDECQNQVVFKAEKVLKKTTGVQSLVWKFFHFKGTTKGPDRTKVFCNICLNVKASGKDKSCLSYTGGTTNLKNHLRSFHLKELQEAEKDVENNNQENTKQITDFFGKGAKKQYKWPKSSVSWKKLTMRLTKWLCVNSRPSYLVEDEGFRYFMEMACPEYEVPCSNTINNYIKELYISEKEKIADRLAEVEFVAITSDGGTSSNAVSFQDTNVHYITEDMHLVSHCLAVSENKEAHTAENYRQNTDDVCEEFGVDEKVVMYVTDNENKMKSAFKKEERSGCMSHLLHSSVTHGIDKTPDVKDIVLKIRRISQKFNKSYSFKYGVESEQKKRSIPVRPIIQDVATRWGSTRVSTESFLDKAEPQEAGEEDGKDKQDRISDVFSVKFENMEAINAALRKIKFSKKQKLADYLLSYSDMIKIEEVNKILTTLDVFSTTLGGNKFVTSSIVMPVNASLRKLMQPDSDDKVYIASMKDLILIDFKKRAAENLNGKFLMKSTALDPRFKNLKVTDSKQGREKVYEDIDHELRELVKKLPKSGEVVVAQKRKKKKLCLDFDESEDEEKEEDDDLSNEIRAYRNEAKLDRSEDPLAWWRSRRTQYPNLCRLVRYGSDNCFSFFHCFYSGNIFVAPGPVHRLREFSRLWGFCSPNADCA